ncbi:hypothetical protein [Pseudorhodoferax sp. Leaf274]|uniref:PD-(D/E)XK nuclease domain-containing protein n=1 Tax=Pseudorhodoferax sp. Leaf274 TaxID=1736318 RepID=UPI000AEBC2ED|nr:hypothetical protein [Pseudorhodoferax sp. Leaf274]
MTFNVEELVIRCGQDQNLGSLTLLGNLLEEFMDLPPKDPEYLPEWRKKRVRVDAALEENGLRYFRFGRVLPQGNTPEERELPARMTTVAPQPAMPAMPAMPSNIEELLEVVVRGLRQAMHPLTHRRKGSQLLYFGKEYGVQDLLHALLRPWISDIRPEELTPNYAGSSTRMDSLLPAHQLVIEIKIVRDRAHSKRVDDELIIDIENYRKRSESKTLWCVVY